MYRSPQHLTSVEYPCATVPAFTLALPAELRASGSSRALLMWSISQLRRHHIVEAAYESRHLLAMVLGVKPSLVQVTSVEVTPEQMDACAAIIARRAAHEPFQYLLGETGFRRGIFTCRPGVLIPRPETETLVERVAFRIAADFPEHRRVLELGTGSGAPIISLAMDFRHATFVATDSDPAALALAAENARRNDVEDRVLFLEGDWWDALSAHRIELPFDIIFSNPPYIPGPEIPNLPREILDHEPHQALDGGPDGLAFYRRTIGEFRDWLQPGGWLIVEVGDGQAGLVQSLFQRAGLQQVEIAWDLHNLPRVVEGRLPHPDDPPLLAETEEQDNDNDTQSD